MNKPPKTPVEKAIENVGLPYTKRQVSKYRRRYGLAYNAKRLGFQSDNENKQERRIEAENFVNRSSV